MDLSKILNNCTPFTEIYDIRFGSVKFLGIVPNGICMTTNISEPDSIYLLNNDGSEFGACNNFCVIHPSKECYNWNLFYDWTLSDKTLTFDEWYSRYEREKINLKTNSIDTIGNESVINADYSPHYTKLTIQPVEYIEKNNLGFSEGCVIKYISRYKEKNGKEDLLKARHYIDYLLKTKYNYNEV